MSRRPASKGLGRGLSALLGEDGPEAGSNPEAPQDASAVPIDLIKANPAQPRRRFDESALQELTDSIRERGVLQPLILRPDPSGQGYQIVAGERRWRAAQRAQLHEVPALVRDLDDAQVLEIAIVENVQRSDLTPLEEARGYARLSRDFGHTQEQVARLVGKSRPHVANMMRLLALPEPVLEMIETGLLSAGHGRALANDPDPVTLASRIASEGLSVREAEALARRRRDAPPKTPRQPRGGKDPDTLALEADLSAALGLPVAVEPRPQDPAKGELRIRYASLDDLDGLCRLLTVGNQ
ncbi:MAG: ParB/RepB/Spo0J family partition protein [Pseudomonadota bacterium]